MRSLQHLMARAMSTAETLKIVENYKIRENDYLIVTCITLEREYSPAAELFPGANRTITTSLRSTGKGTLGDAHHGTFQALLPMEN